MLKKVFLFIAIIALFAINSNASDAKEKASQTKSSNVNVQCDKQSQGDCTKKTECTTKSDCQPKASCTKQGNGQGMCNGSGRGQCKM